MTQFAYIQLRNSWNDLATLLGTTTVTQGNTYTFEARGGASGALIQEADTKPTSNEAGVYLDRGGMKSFTWVAGDASKVWLKGNSCYVNITETAAEADPVVPEVNSEET